MADLPYIEKMYAACVVADYILWHMVPKSKQQKEQSWTTPTPVLSYSRQKPQRIGTWLPCPCTIEIKVSRTSTKSDQKSETSTLWQL